MQQHESIGVKRMPQYPRHHATSNLDQFIGFQFSIVVNPPDQDACSIAQPTNGCQDITRGCGRLRSYTTCASRTTIPNGSKLLPQSSNPLFIV
jgi:hypothetical protein